MRRAEELINRFGEWSLERLPALLLKAVVVLLILLFGIQAGLRKGRQIEKDEAQYALDTSRAGEQ